MARILINESHESVRRLLERMVARLGHEPVPIVVPTPEHLLDADLLLVEPVAPLGAVLAQAVHIATPSLPIISASVSAPPPELAELGIEFAASLVKPFTLEDLDTAIKQALARYHQSA
jgi:hypothetical protein